ncbi:MAG: LytTR family DNA-binding domain-containing protein [Saprospiraceae bacterium]
MSLHQIHTSPVANPQGKFRIVHLSRKKAETKLVIITKYEVFAIPFTDILYCEAQNNYTMVYCREGKKILCSRTLKNISESLHDGSFLRIHKTYLVKESEIKLFQKQTNEIVLTGQIILPVSRSRRQEVISSFLRMN